MRHSLCKRVVVDVVPGRSSVEEVGAGHQGRVGLVLCELERPQVGGRVLGLDVLHLLGEGLRAVTEQAVRTLQRNSTHGLCRIRCYSGAALNLISKKTDYAHAHKCLLHLVNAFLSRLLHRSVHLLLILQVT